MRIQFKVKFTNFKSFFVLHGHAFLYNNNLRIEKTRYRPKGSVTLYNFVVERDRTLNYLRE